MSSYSVQMADMLHIYNTSNDALKRTRGYNRGDLNNSNRIHNIASTTSNFQDASEKDKTLIARNQVLMSQIKTK